MSSRSTTQKTTYAIALKARHELPRAVELATAMQRGDFGQHLFEIHFRLLGLLAEEFDRPLFTLAKERKERVEQLVPRHTRHALVLSFLGLDFRALRKRQIQNQIKKKNARVVRTVRSAKPDADDIPLLSIFPPPRPAFAPSISPTRTAFSLFAAAPRAAKRRS